MTTYPVEEWGPSSLLSVSLWSSQPKFPRGGLRRITHVSMSISLPYLRLLRETIVSLISIVVT